MTRGARNFLIANEQSPVVYGSVVGSGITYRLADGKMFNLSRADSAHARNPRWAHHEAEPA